MAEILLFCSLISRAYDIPPEILPAIIRVESSFRKDAVSHKGAVGLMQVTRPAFDDYRRRNPKGRVKTWEQVCNDWRANINVGAWYLSRVCYSQTGNWSDSFTAYFWGANHPAPTALYKNKVLSHIEGGEI